MYSEFDKSTKTRVRRDLFTQDAGSSPLSPPRAAAITVRAPTPEHPMLQHEDAIATGGAITTHQTSASMRSRLARRRNGRCRGARRRRRLSLRENVRRRSTRRRKLGRLFDLAAPAIRQTPKTILVIDNDQDTRWVVMRRWGGSVTSSRRSARRRAPSRQSPITPFPSLSPTRGCRTWTVFALSRSCARATVTFARDRGRDGPHLFDAFSVRHPTQYRASLK